MEEHEENGKGEKTRSKGETDDCRTKEENHFEKGRSEEKSNKETGTGAGAGEVKGLPHQQVPQPTDFSSQALELI